MDRQSRRWFLTVAGTGLVGLAGCSGPGEEEDDGEEDGEDNGDDEANDDGEDEEAESDLRDEASVTRGTTR